MGICFSLLNVILLSNEVLLNLADLLLSLFPPDFWTHEVKISRNTLFFHLAVYPFFSGIAHRYFLIFRHEVKVESILNSDGVEFFGKNMGFFGPKVPKMRVFKFYEKRMNGFFLIVCRKLDE